MSEFPEAVVVLAKCTQAHKTYGIRVEKAESKQLENHMGIPDQRVNSPARRI